jgi:hypothetical protein
MSLFELALLLPEVTNKGLIGLQPFLVGARLKESCCPVLRLALTSSRCTKTAAVASSAVGAKPYTSALSMQVGLARRCWSSLILFGYCLRHTKQQPRGSAYTAAIDDSLCLRVECVVMLRKSKAV